MNLANEEDLQEIKQQLSEIKLTTKKKLQTNDNHNASNMSAIVSNKESSGLLNYFFRLYCHFY